MSHTAIDQPNMGRLGSILAPLAAGSLLYARWRPDEVYSLYAIALVLATITVVLLHFSVKKAIDLRRIPMYGRSLR